MNYKEGGFAEVIEEFKRMRSAGICCTDGVLCTVLRACGKMEDGGRTARQVHAFAMKLQGGLNGKGQTENGSHFEPNALLFHHLYWEIDPSELDFSNKLCHDWDGKKWKTGDLRDTWNATEPLAIMALPAILNSSNNFELLRKSEAEVFDMIESAITVAALRFPEKLLAQKHRIFKPYDMACRSSSTNDNDDGGYNSTGYNQKITKEEEEEPVYNQEITKEDEEEPTKPRRRIIRIKLLKDGKPTTATTVGSGTGATTATTVGSAATTVGRGMGANRKMASDVPWSNSEEYEKKLENSKRKLKEGYSKFEDSKKRSKVCMRILQRWDNALRAYTVKASQASSLHLVLEATLGLQAMNKRTTTRISMPSSPDRSISCCSLLPMFTGCTFAICCKDYEEAERSKFPLYFNGSKPFQCTVKVGEILYLPSMWFQHVRQSPDERGCTIGWYFATSSELLGHQKEAVRKKAIMALHRFYQKSPSSVSHLVSNFRKRLCDNDPGVMGATLCPLFDLISRDVNSFKDLVISFGYAMTALMKIYAFAMAAGRKVDVLPEVGIPSLLLTIQDRLLDSISVVLAKSHYAHGRQVVPVGRGGTTNAAQQISDVRGPALVQLALQTLARFNFKLVEKLLIAAVADADVNVRHSIFSPLYENFLAQADCLSAVYAALNDEIITNGNYRSAVTNSSMARLSVATFHDPAKTRNISPAPEIVYEK
ncbi:AP-4 complex subunit epsilon [Linum grandiflorum]